MEYLDLYDEERNLTNKYICRGDKISDGEYILLTGIFFENSNGEILMQYTSPAKDSEWAITGGHVTRGEDTLTAIVREVEEELGLSIDKKNIKLIKTVKWNHVFFDLYYVYMDINIDNLKLQQEEVDFVKWCTLDEVEQFKEAGTLRKSAVNMIRDYKEYKKVK